MPWLLPQIGTYLFELRMGNWTTARDEIKSLPWIVPVHNELGERAMASLNSGILS
jgi:hypothetical protein